MRGVRVHNTGISTATHRIFTGVTITFGLLMALVFITTPNAGRITGYSVLSDLYGNAGPAVLMFTLILVIGLYLRFVE